MGAGCRRGERRRSRWGLALFVDEDGYTSVAVAVALLVSVSLVFCVATVEWTTSRAADVQAVADAASLSGSNAVAACCTVAQVLDATVLSMGLLGMTMLGAGLVLAAVPGAQAASGEVLDAGRNVLEQRRRFARSAAEGLRRLEQAMPFLVLANSASCVGANAEDGMSYVGAAIPFPLESQSDYAGLDSEVTDDGVSEAAERLQDATRRVEEAKRRADDARRRGWIADCVDSPSCLKSRASSLAGLSGFQNPFASSPEAWNFGMPINRSRAYYARRLAIEAPQAPDIESITDSCARRAFYEYALGEVNGSWYRELPDGSVDLQLEHLARNSQEMRDTWLYDDFRWPCTDEPDGVTLHSVTSCPGALGAFLGGGSVAEIEAGTVRRCDACRMDVGDLGAVAAISTSATNGYEHYWQQIVEAASDYQAARNEQAEAERAMRDVAEEGKQTFERALEQLRTPRPRFCPPGAWGCVGVVGRPGGVSAPSELTRAFLSDTSLPAGMAVSAAALAPDENTDGGGVLGHFFDGVSRRAGPSVAGLASSVMRVWGGLLVSYGRGFEGVGDAAGGFLDRLDGAFGSSVGAWLKRAVGAAISTLGLQPADMRLKKPVLVHTSDVLGRAGIEPSGKVRQLVQSLPSNGDVSQWARALGIWVWDQRRGTQIDIGDLPVPWSDSSVPLSIDLAGLGGAT